jgi:hypothetical protein
MRFPTKDALLPLAVWLTVAVVIASMAAVGCGSRDGPPAPAVTARPTQVLSPTPTAPARVERRSAVPTPVPAAVAGRPDCPQGWNAYRDPDGHFSLCYPPGLDIVADALHIGQPEVNGLSLDISTALDATGARTNGFTIAMGWHLQPPFNPSVPLAQLCPHSPLLTFQDSSVPVEVQIAGRKAAGCLATGSGQASGPPMKVLHLALPVSAGGGQQRGYIHFEIRYVGPDLAAAETKRSAILNTLVIEER